MSQTNTLENLEQKIRSGELIPAPTQGTKRIQGYEEIGKISTYETKDLLNSIHNSSILTIKKNKEELDKINTLLQYVDGLDLDYTIQGHVARLLTPKIIYEKKVENLVNKGFNSFLKCEKEKNYQLTPSITQTDSKYIQVMNIVEEVNKPNKEMLDILNNYSEEYDLRKELDKQINYIHTLAIESKPDEKKEVLSKINGKLFSRGLYKKCKLHPAGRDKLQEIINYITGEKSANEVKLEVLQKKFDQDKQGYESTIKKINTEFEKRIKEKKSAYESTLDKKNVENDKLQETIQWQDREITTKYNITQKLSTLEKNIVKNIQQTREEIEEVKNYTLNKIDSIGKTLEEKKMREELPQYNFSLPAHMLDIGFPQNREYFVLRKLLSKPSSTWTNTFKEVDSFLDKAQRDNLDFKKEDEYLSLITTGLKKAIEQPTTLFDCEAATNTYHKFVEILT